MTTESKAEVPETIWLFKDRGQAVPTDYMPFWSATKRHDDDIEFRRVHVSPDSPLWKLATDALAETRSCDDCESPAVWERSDDPETHWFVCDSHKDDAQGWWEIKTVRLALAVAVSPDSDVARRAAEQIATWCAAHKQVCVMNWEMEQIKDIIQSELASVPDGWRDIESAPKDCSWFLAVMRTGRQAVIRWGGGAWEDDSRLCRDPVAWRPLPALPVDVDDKEKP